MQQDGILQLLGQLGNDKLVLHQMGLIVGAVFLPLLVEGAYIPRGLPAQLMLDGHALGKVQMAVLVHAGTQLTLHLCQLRWCQHGDAEAVLHIAPQDGLRSPALQKGQGVGPLLPGLLLVGAAAGLLQTAQGVGPHEAAGLSAPAADRAAHPHAPLPVGDATAGTLEIAEQQRLHLVHDLLLVPRGIEGHGVQHFLLPRVLLRLMQYPAEPRRPQPLRAAGIGGVGLGQHPAGILLPQLLQHGALLQRFLVGHALQSQPEQVAVQLALGLMLKGVEQGLKFIELIAPVHETDNGVHVELGLAVGIVGLEFRTHVVVFRAVPHLIGRAAALDIFSVHISRQTASTGRRPWGCGSTPRPPPTAARRDRRPC